MTEIGELTNAIYEVQEENKQLNKQIDSNKKKIEQLKVDLLHMLDSAGVDYARTGIAKAVITDTDLPTIREWEVLKDYIMESGQIWLLEKRLSIATARDVINSGESIPGVSMFNKRSVTIGKAPKSK